MEAYANADEEDDERGGTSINACPVTGSMWMLGLAAKRAEERWPGGVAGAVNEVEVPDDDPE